MFTVNVIDFIVTVEFYYDKNKTICLLESSDNPNWLGVGKSERHPKDPYKKSVGQKRALQKALETADFNKDERALIWAEYLYRYKSLLDSDNMVKNETKLEKKKDEVTLNYTFAHPYFSAYTVG